MTDPLDLAELLASHLCHELVGSVGAVVNGMEVLEESGDDPAVRDEAVALVGASAAEASARLQFFRLAFGTAGGAGEISLGEAARLAAGRFATGRVRLDWSPPGRHVPKDLARTVLNLVLVAADALPRGGAVRVVVDVEAGGADIVAEGEGAALPDFHAAALGLGPPADDLPPRAAPAFLARELARAASKTIRIETKAGRLALGLRAGI